MESLLQKKIIIISSGGETEAVAIRLCKEIVSDASFSKLGIKAQIARADGRKPKDVLQSFLANECSPESVRFVFLHDRQTILSRFNLMVDNTQGLVVKTKTAEIEGIKKVLLDMYI